MRIWFREGSLGRPWAAPFQILPGSLLPSHQLPLLDYNLPSSILCSSTFTPPLLSAWNILSHPHPLHPDIYIIHSFTSFGSSVKCHLFRESSRPKTPLPTVFPTSIPCFRFNTTCDHSFCFVYSLVDCLPQAPWR